MAYVDFMTQNHSSTKRDYLARVNDKDFPKHKAATLAKQWDFDYWDGDRRINYGGYKYIPGRWLPIAKSIAEHYQLKAGQKVLDIGCGKGFLIYELSQHISGLNVCGIDISEYAKTHCKPEVEQFIDVGNATKLPYPNDHFDLVISINTLHNLHNYELEKSLNEINRVSKGNSYICVESYRNEVEKANLLYWQVTCEAFNTPKEWEWWFDMTNYQGDYSFIFFN